MAAISAYKCNIIRNPFSSLNDNNKKSFLYFMMFTVCICGVLVVPPLVGFSAYSHIEGRLYCSIRSQQPVHDKWMMLIIALVGFVCPLASIVVTSTCAFVSFQRQGRIRMEIRRMSLEEVSSQNHRMVCMLLLLVVSFLVLWTPMFVYVVLNLMGVQPPLLFNYLAYLFMFLQGCLNPYIYCLKHPHFKTQIWKLLQRCRRKHNHHDDNIEEAIVVFTSVCLPIYFPTQPPNQISKSENRN